MPHHLKTFLRLVLLFAPIALTLACGDDDPEPIPDISGSCQQQDQHCDSSGDCCGVLTCNANKVCGSGGCQGAGTSCTSSPQCCVTLVCRGGFCQ